MVASAGPYKRRALRHSHRIGYSPLLPARAIHSCPPSHQSVFLCSRLPSSAARGRGVFDSRFSAQGRGPAACQRLLLNLSNPLPTQQVPLKMCLFAAALILASVAGVTGVGGGSPPPPVYEGRRDVSNVYARPDPIVDATSAGTSHRVARAGPRPCPAPTAPAPTPSTTNQPAQDPPVTANATSAATTQAAATAAIATAAAAGEAGAAEAEAAEAEALLYLATYGACNGQRRWEAGYGVTFVNPAAAAPPGFTAHDTDGTSKNTG